APSSEIISDNHDFVLGMLGQAPQRAKGESEQSWSRRLANFAQGAKAAGQGTGAHALFAKAVLARDRFDAALWAEIATLSQEAR
ncbi:MAG TPA: hypothetical protein VGN36_04635, partial [Sphingorhabdus sp.]|nr:hypothetical protein [Sphingorhabdus sp.]